MRRYASLALALAMMLPYGQAWAGFCAMAGADSHSGHSCPHHRGEAAAAGAHCHSKSPETAPDAALRCNCGSGGDQGTAAIGAFDRLGVVEAFVTHPPGNASGRLEVLGQDAPDDRSSEPPTPPPRASSRQ